MDEFSCYRLQNSRRIDRPKLYYPIYVGGRVEKSELFNLTWSDENQSWIPREELKNDEVLVFPIDSDNQESLELRLERAAQVAPFDLVAKNVNGDWQIYRKYPSNLEGTYLIHGGTMQNTPQQKAELVY